MYSKLHLQLTDKSTLCWAWRMAVKMKIHHGMLLCQEEGHFRFPPLTKESLLEVKPKWPFCLRLELRGFNIVSSLFSSMTWQFSGLFCSTAVSPRSLTALLGQKKTWLFLLCVNNIYYLLRENGFISTERWFSMCVSTCKRVLLRRLDKNQQMTELYCRAAVRVWLQRPISDC